MMPSTILLKYFSFFSPIFSYVLFFVNSLFIFNRLRHQWHSRGSHLRFFTYKGHGHQQCSLKRALICIQLLISFQWSNLSYFLWKFVCISIIHTYESGYYNPLVRIIELVSYTTQVVCINFIHKWWDLQFKVDSERQIFLKNFSWQFFYSQSFWQ